MTKAKQDRIVPEITLEAFPNPKFNGDSAMQWPWWFGVVRTVNFLEYVPGEVLQKSHLDRFIRLGMKVILIPFPEDKEEPTAESAAEPK